MCFSPFFLDLLLDKDNTYVEFGDLITSEKFLGPFATENDFNIALRDVCVRRRGSEYQHLDKQLEPYKHDIVFTHGYLAFDNSWCMRIGYLQFSIGGTQGGIQAIGNGFPAMRAGGTNFCPIRRPSGQML